MTTPRDRVAVGRHVFPFSGLHSGDEVLPDLPMLPIRVRHQASRWSHAINAIVDTGSTRSLIPGDLAADLGVPRLGPDAPMQGAGGAFDAWPTECDLSIVDGQFPEVPCFQIDGVSFGVPVVAEPMAFPVLGWDVLRLFELSLSHRRARIEMRLEP